MKNFIKITAFAIGVLIASSCSANVDIRDYDVTFKKQQLMAEFDYSPETFLFKLNPMFIDTPFVSESTNVKVFVPNKIGTVAKKQKNNRTMFRIRNNC